STRVAPVSRHAALPICTLVASVAGNDSDADVGDTLSYSLGTGPAHGVVTFNANGSYSYVHDDSETVADGFTYTVTDAAGHTASEAGGVAVSRVDDNTPV